MMKRYLTPEMELIRLNVEDILTASGETPSGSSGSGAGGSSAAAPSSSAAVTVPPSVSDAGLDNEVSGNKWAF